MTCSPVYIFIYGISYMISPKLDNFFTEKLKSIYGDTDLMGTLPHMISVSCIYYATSVKECQYKEAARKSPQKYISFMQNYSGCKTGASVVFYLYMRLRGAYCLSLIWG